MEKMTKKEKLKIKIVFLFMLQLILLSGLWAIDIGVSGMIWEECLGVEAQAQGLLFIRDANSQYHLGLLLVIMVFIIQLVWMIEILLKGGGEKNSTSKTTRNDN